MAKTTPMPAHPTTHRNHTLKSDQQKTDWNPLPHTGQVYFPLVALKYLFHVSGLSTLQQGHFIAFTLGKRLWPVHSYDPDFQADTTLDEGTPRHALDAETEAYIVLPPQIIRAVSQIVLGCRATVLNGTNGLQCDAVVADVGSRFQGRGNQYRVRQGPRNRSEPGDGRGTATSHPLHCLAGRPRLSQWQDVHAPALPINHRRSKNSFSTTVATEKLSAALILFCNSGAMVSVWSSLSDKPVPKEHRANRRRWGLQGQWMYVWPSQLLRHYH